MRRCVLNGLAATVAALACIATSAYAADPAIGQWRTAENAGVVKVAKCGDGLCGFVVTSERLQADPTLKDLRNRDPSLRNRTIRGLALFQDMQGGPRLWKGKVYNPVDGGTYAGSIRLMDDGDLRLEGCLVWPVCKSQTWTRLR